MPLQRSWVEHWLSSYCPPEAHAFAPWAPWASVCWRCGKVALTRDRTCLICGLAGDEEIRLVKARNGKLELHGRLCTVCLEEFWRREIIGGWLVGIA
jgi:hypothetical protein